MEQNPFNMECPGQLGPGSWQTFHVSLAESSDIVTNTLRHKLSMSSPAGEDAITSIDDPRNPWGIYATNPNW